MSLQVEQLNSQIETKTKDNVFVVIKLSVQYKVGANEQQVQDAYYKLDDPEVQMQSYAFDVVRSHIPSMDLDEAYADADTIAMHIQETLHRNMAEYGYEIVKALITNIEPDQRVKDAMNNINASQRNQIAAAAQGDAQKTLAVKKAEGEKETMRLQGEGVAEERKAIAEGLKESLEIIAQQGSQSSHDDPPLWVRWADFAEAKALMQPPLPADGADANGPLPQPQAHANGRRRNFFGRKAGSGRRDRQPDLRARPQGDSRGVVWSVWPQSLNAGPANSRSSLRA